MTAAADASQATRTATAVLDAISHHSGARITSGPLEGVIAVFNDSDQDGIWIGVYSAGTHGASLVESRTFRTDARATYRKVLSDLGVRIGTKYLGHELVWVVDEIGCCVWSSRDIRMTGTGLELSLPTGAIHTSDIRAVVSFVDDDLIRRGVRLELVDDTQTILVDEVDEIAEMDPTYNRDNLELSDAHWVSKLGQDFAAWFHVPHRDEAFP